LPEVFKGLISLPKFDKLFLSTVPDDGRRSLLKDKTPIISSLNISFKAYSNGCPIYYSRAFTSIFGSTFSLTPADISSCFGF
jgi:hypothetical protein